MVLVLAGLAGTACGAGAAGKAVRPDDPTAASALGDKDTTAGSAACTKVASHAEPLVVDWKTNEQLDLALALKSGVAMVAYDCSGIRLLKSCSAKGRYGFASVSSVLEESVKLEDADSARASLPLGGVKLGGSLDRSSSIDIALAYVGKKAVLDDQIARADITGDDCAQATHYVRAATVGAFVMQTGTRGQATAAADLFGVGASGSSTSSKQRLNSGGDVSACKSIKDGDQAPPDGCAAIVRLELVSLGDASAVADSSKGAAPLANTCPDGFMSSGEGACVKKGGAAAYRCQPDDKDDCKAQCDKGNAESCYNLAILTPRQMTLDNPRQLLFRKACDGDVPNGCFNAGIENELTGQTARARDLYQKGCNLLQPSACDRYAANLPSSSFEDKRTYERRACGLGLYDACKQLAQLDLAGCSGPNCTPGTRYVDEAVGQYDTWCTAGKMDSCKALAFVYGFGATESIAKAKGATQVAPDQGKWQSYQAQFCKLGGKGCNLGGDTGALGLAGTYTSPQIKGPITVVQAGDFARMTFGNGATVDCNISSAGNIPCTWRDPSKKKSTSGPVTFARKPDGTISGAWGYDTSTKPDGHWDLTPAKH
jgi:uncharacterized protein